MITAIVLIDCATDSIPEVAESLASLDGVSEVYSVAGSVDLIAIVRVREFDQIAEVIAGGISKVDGVLNTEMAPVCSLIATTSVNVPPTSTPIRCCAAPDIQFSLTTPVSRLG